MARVDSADFRSETYWIRYLTTIELARDDRVTWSSDHVQLLLSDTRLRSLFKGNTDGRPRRRQFFAKRTFYHPSGGAHLGMDGLHVC